MDEVTKQWSLCGRQVDCTYREKAVPDDKVRITGSWSCGRYENLKIRSTVKKETDVEQYLKRQIEKTADGVPAQGTGRRCRRKPRRKVPP